MTRQSSEAGRLRIIQIPGKTMRKPSIYYSRAQQLKVEGLTTYKIAGGMDISRMSIHRILGLKPGLSHKKENRSGLL
jgi:hypothetical protein